MDNQGPGFAALQQDTQQPTNEDIGLLALLTVLLILSAIPVTATPVLYLGFFILLLVWIAAWQNQTLQGFGTELFSKGNP